MSQPAAQSPTYGEWFNGNPYLMIEHGTYKKFRNKLKGFTIQQMKEFDKLDKSVNGDSSDKRKVQAQKAASKGKK